MFKKSKSGWIKAAPGFAPFGAFVCLFAKVLLLRTHRRARARDE